MRGRLTAGRFQRQRQPAALRQFEISRVVRCKSETVAQLQCRRPGLVIGSGIDRANERPQIGERGIPIGDVDPAAAHRDVEAVEHFEAPQRRYHGARFRHPIEYGDARRRRSSSKYHASVIELSMTRLTGALR